MNALRRLTLTGVVLGCVSLGGLALSDAPALAMLQYPLMGEISTAAASGGGPVNNVALDGENAIVGREREISAFGSVGDLEWFVNSSNQQQLSVGGVAVNEGTGEIYVGARFAHVVDIFSATGTYVAEINGEGGGKPVPGGLVAPESVAIDQTTGEVYVFDNRSIPAIDVFSAGGEYLFQITDAGGKSLGFIPGLAVDDPSNSLLVGHMENSGEDVVYVLNATTGGYIETWSGANTPQKAFVGLTGLKIAADNATGDVYIAANGLTTYDEVTKQRKTTKPAIVDRLSATGEYESQIRGLPGETFSAFEAMRGVAVSQSSGDVYVLYECSREYPNEECPVRNPGGSVYIFGNPVGVPRVGVEAPSSVESRSVTLQGVLNPEETGEATCEFEYGTSLSYGQRAPCTAPVANGNAPVPVQAELMGLKSGTTYYYRLDGKNVADGDTNLGEYGEAVGQFATPGPRLLSESVSSVNAEAASLEATIVPNGLPASAYFEYGTSEAYGATIPPPPGVALGSSTTALEFSRHVQGLQPGTEYHYRLVVLSEVQPGKREAVYGEDHTFTTQAAGGSFSLLDGRQWEMVSPPTKLGALIEPLLDGAVQASAGGDVIAYRTNSPSEVEPQGYSHVETVLSTRGSGGWSSLDISPPHNQAGGSFGLSGSEFQVFSRDLSLAAIRPVSSEFTPLSGEASESTLYLRSDFPAGSVEARCTASCYRPLVTAANTPSGTVFGEEPNGYCEQQTCGPRFWGASPDLSHVILSSPAQLTEMPAPAGSQGLYEWSAGHLQLLDVLPRGEEGPAILAGSAISSRTTGVRHAVSDNGERVILEGGSSIGKEGVPAGGNSLYLRDVGAGETIRLDVAQGGKGPSEGVRYATASSDASRIFFLDRGRLTAKSSASGEDLYEYDANAPAGSRLVDLSVDQNAGEAAEVKTVIGASEDGSYVYFMAGGVLVPGAKAGQLNLYVRHEGETKLAVALPMSDYGGLYSVHLFGRVSPNGEWLAFMSRANLTGYDTRDAVSGQPDAEVYLYGSASGKLVCASCDPTGARPVGAYIPYESPSLLVSDGLGGSWVAANVTPWLAIQPFGAYVGTFYQPRYLSDSGRLFFDSADALVAHDVNGAEDVYEYEPAGAGNCSASSAVFAPRSNGCLGLVSSGTSPTESGFLDASETGGDVFFMTQAKLASQDYDTAYDVYDAHECTSVVPCLPVPASQSPPCETEASCRAAPSPQPALYGAPASATFSGTGNVASPSTLVAKSKSKAKRNAKTVKCRKRKGKPRCAKTKKGSRRASRAKSRASKSRRGGKR
jgi:hypothetical protein